MIIENEEGVDAVLAHFGVKGMKWGVRRAASAVATGAKKVKVAVEDRDREIEEARKALPGERANLKEAKKQFKTDKQELGRKEARSLLKERGKAYYETRQKAWKDTSYEKVERELGKHFSTLDQKRRAREFEQLIEDLFK